MRGELERFPRKSYNDISVYAPQRGVIDLDLSDNTNQWGAPPSVASVLAAIDPRELTQYPSQPTWSLQKLLAQYVGINDPGSIVTGCGSDDLLDCMMRAFAEAGDRVVHASPTFSMAHYFARSNGLEVVSVPLLDNWDIDVDSMLALEPRILYLCAPNNPTGTMLRPESVRRIIAEAPGLVVIDEAYAEFAGDTWVDVAISEQRLFVTRTMSKAFGLAGLRVGYGIGAPALVREVEKARGPYKLTVVSERIAMSVLERDTEWVKARVNDAIEMREWLRAALVARGMKPLPSGANFLLVPCNSASAVAAGAARSGILLRHFTDLPLVGDAIRITVAPRAQLERFLAVLDELMT